MSTAEVHWNKLATNIVIYNHCAESQKNHFEDENQLYSSEKESTIYELSDFQNKIYKDDIVFILSNISTYWTPLIISIFEDMEFYNFHKTPSVTGNKWNYHNDFNLDSGYELFKRISLDRHLINVVAEAIMESDRKNRTPYLKDISIILAIFHDTGKNKGIIRKYGTNEISDHWKISSLYASEKLNELFKNQSENEYKKSKSLIDEITKTLFYHHDKISSASTIFMEMLTNADTTAREKEMDYLKRISK